MTPNHPESLVVKYNVAGPRYTSYPTVPHWDVQNFTNGDWVNSVKKSVSKSGIAIYIHLPYCESLCTFCGCNKRITKNHNVERPYLDAVIDEWKMYLSFFEKKPILKELHLGGGTPTFFSPKNLTYLITEITKYTQLADEVDFSFEGHPNNTTAAHLQALYDVGFRRVSFGIQCFDKKVQIAINRIQSFESVAKVVETARSIGYSSVNFDVIYGLPFQDIKAIKNTFEKVVLLKPDRIAFYSYAHVPWIKGNGQRKFEDSDLPNANSKIKQHQLGKKVLENAGYQFIGMDHFALKAENLALSASRKELHRNFMGYTTRKTDLLIGLGVSAISDSGTAFSQNFKSVEEYIARVNSCQLPIFRGHLLTKMDVDIRRIILEIMCRYETNIPYHWFEDYAFMVRINELRKDFLIDIEENKLMVTNLGRSFLRNIAMVFDQHLHSQITEQNTFSMTV